MGESSNKIKDLFWKLKKSPKAQAIILVIFLIIVAVIAGLLIFLPGTGDRITELVGNKDLGGEGDVRLIDGVKTNPGMENLFPQAIVIENLATVRPQAGLQEANLVYEFLAEGGITRFLAVYASGDHIELIGPVRSARHYIVDLAEEYHGLFAHIGGSPQALGILNVNDYLVDLNQFANSQYYWRDAEVAAPHNLFTSSDLMFYAQRDKVGEEAQGDFMPWKFKKEADKDERPPEDKYVKINFSSGAYEVEWKYDPDTNAYYRLNGGLEHTDKGTEKQLTAKNIIVQYAETSLLEAGTGRLDIRTQGEGEAVVFMDGTAVAGTWKKAERGSRTLYYGPDGEEMEFNPGKSWIEIVPTDRPVEYN